MNALAAASLLEAFREGAADPLANPLLHNGLFAMHLGALAALTVVVMAVLRSRWRTERERVREAILDHQGLGPGRRADAEALDRVRVLVPCRGVRLVAGGKGEAAFGGGQRLWLCFLEDRMLVVPGGTGEIYDLPLGDLSKMNLMPDTLSFALEIKGNPYKFRVSRLADMVRIVNVLIRSNVVLGYLEA